MWVRGQTYYAFQQLVVACANFNLNCGKPKYSAEIMAIQASLYAMMGLVTRAEFEPDMDVETTSSILGIEAQCKLLVGKKEGGRDNQTFGTYFGEIFKKLSDFSFKIKEDIRVKQAESRAAKGEAGSGKKAAIIKERLNAIKIYDEAELRPYIDGLGQIPEQFAHPEKVSIIKSAFFHYPKTMGAAAFGLVSGLNALGWSLANKYFGEQMDKGLHTEKTGVDAEMLFGFGCLLFTMTAAGVVLIKRRCAQPKLMEVPDDEESLLGPSDPRSRRAAY